MRFRFVVRLEGGDGSRAQQAAHTAGKDEQAAEVEREQPVPAAERGQPVLPAAEQGNSVLETAEREHSATAPDHKAVPRRAQQLGPEERQRQHLQHGAASLLTEEQAAGSLHGSLTSVDSGQGAVAAAGAAHVGAWHVAALAAITALFLAGLWALGMYRQRQRRLQRAGSDGGLAQPLHLARAGHASSRRAFSGAGCTSRSVSQGAS